MATSISTDLADDINDGIFNNTALQVAQAYLSLHTGDPSTTGANEVTGGSYARQTIPQVASSSGTYTSDANIDFTDMPSTTVTHIGIWSAESGGTFYCGASLSSSQAFDAGDTARMASGNLTSTPAGS